MRVAECNSRMYIAYILFKSISKRLLGHTEKNSCKGPGLSYGLRSFLTIWIDKNELLDKIIMISNSNKCYYIFSFRRIVFTSDAVGNFFEKGYIGQITARH